MAYNKPTANQISLGSTTNLDQVINPSGAWIGSPTGLQGATGAQGANGSNGTQGATGAQGANGSNGTQGATGTQGTTGAQGTIGGSTIPSSSNTTLAVGDVGKCVSVSGTVTVPNSTFAAGDCVSIFNNSGSTITITMSIGTAYLAGTSSTGNRSLYQRGLASIWFISSTSCVITGAGVI